MPEIWKRVLPAAAAVAAASLAPLQAAPTGWPDPVDPLAGMGVNIHFTDPPPGELEMISRAGFRWVRMDLTWAATEKAPGVYDFSHYDPLLAALDRWHIRAMLILDYTNPLYDGGKPSCTDAGRAAFAHWAVAAVRHFQNRGVLWEIWNEPNGGWFWKPKPNPDDYAKLAVTVSQAIHDAAPAEPIVGPALSGTNLDFVETAAKAGALRYWRGITIHPYLRDGPESYGPAYAQTRRLIAKYAPADHPVDPMCGESGYATTWPGIDDVTQGRYLARLFLFDVMSRIPLTIWYDWRDDGTEPQNQEHHFGIVRYATLSNGPDVHEPKPAYEAATTYARELSGYRFRRRLAEGGANDYVLLFINGTSECLVAWTSSSATHDVTIPAGHNAYRVTAFDGQAEPEVTAAGGKLTVTLGPGPQYLHPR